MKPLTPWVVAEESGKIVAAHCDCMAGLGESCSHVASLLFAIESGVRIRDSMTVTQKKAYWVMPTGVKEVQYAPVKDIGFLGKKRSAWMMESCNFRSPTPTASTSSSTSTTPRSSKSPTPVASVAPPDCEEIKAFFGSLASCSSKPAILSLVEPYSSQYVPKSLHNSLPQCLSELFKPEYLKLNYSELVKLATECTLTVTVNEAKAVEEKTRSQTISRLWFRMRTGRVTASRLKSVCRTNPALPSQSLIMAICNPEMAKFKSAATNWGCDHEKTAISKYFSVNLRTHLNFRVTECGFFISTIPIPLWVHLQMVWWSVRVVSKESVKSR